jgi:ferredoxin
MADASAKVTENAVGPFFVDETCTGCGICVEEAPRNFMLSGKNLHAFVLRQPVGETERAQCEGALNSCPVGAIGRQRGA